jgi:hypothetical protein
MLQKRLPPKQWRLFDPARSDISKTGFGGKVGNDAR